MRSILLISAVAFVIWIIYNSLQTLYVIRLERELKKQDLKTYIEKLGTDHRYRDLGNGFIRHKWKKGWMVIKADFDEAMISYNEKFIFWFHNIAKTGTRNQNVLKES